MRSNDVISVENARSTNDKFSREIVEVIGKVLKITGFKLVKRIFYLKLNVLGQLKPLALSEERFQFSRDVRS